MSTMLEVAEANRGKILFAYSDMTHKQAKNLASAMDITEEMMPILAIIAPSNRQKVHYCKTPPSELTAQVITQFVDEVISDKFDPVIKSQSLPESNDEPLKIVVGHSYKEIVLDDQKDVFVLFYAPWDMFSKKYLKLMKELAEDMKSYTDLVIAKFDGTANEYDGLTLMGYPRLALLPKDDKMTGEVYNGGRDLQEMKDWLFKNLPNLSRKDEL